MKYFFLCVYLVLIFGVASSCGAARPVAGTADSTRVEVRYETQTVHDTAYVELPVIIEKIQTLDTTSKLEYEYALKKNGTSAAIPLGRPLSVNPNSSPSVSVLVPLT